MAAILHTAGNRHFSTQDQSDRLSSGPSFVRGPSILVIDTPSRTTAPHGLSHHEMDWVTEGMRYLRRQGPAVFVTVEAYDQSERERRVLFRKVKSDILLNQRRARM